MIRGVLALVLGHHHGLALGAHHNLVLGPLEIFHVHQPLVGPRSKQRGLVDEVGQISAGKTGSTPRQNVRLHVGGNRHFAHMHHQNLFASTNVGQRHHHLAVKTARSQQRRIEHVGPVGRGNDDHPRTGLESVHFDQQLVERLLALVVATSQARAALATNRVDFVDEHDARGMLLGLLEHVAHPRRTNTDEHFNEVRTGN